MKTIVLSAAVLFMATAAFAQSVNSDVNASAKATASTKVVTSTETKAAQGTKKTIHAANSERKAVQEQAKTDIATAKKETGNNAKGSVSTQSDLSVKASNKDNISANQASLNQQSAAAESTSINANTTGLKKEVKMAGDHSVNTAIKTGETAKATVHSADAKVEPKAKAVKPVVKPKPASVKVNTHVTAASGIRIK